jgi:hypothetical protein
MFYHARYYAPTLGRFIQADTIIPNPGSSQDFNRYTYVRNNPLKYIDPTGHFTDSELRALFGLDHTIENPIEYLTSLYGEEWAQILRNASWEDQVTIGDNIYAFVYGRGRWRGTYYTDDWDRVAELDSKTRLALWDVKNLRSANFVEVALIESKWADGMTWARKGSNDVWLPPDYNQTNRQADEYVWFPGLTTEMWEDLCWLRAEMTVMLAGVATGNVGIGGAMTAFLEILQTFFDAADLAGDMTEVDGFIPSSQPVYVPHLRSGSPVQEMVWWSLRIWPPMGH